VGATLGIARQESDEAILMPPDRRFIARDGAVRPALARGERP
jgi:hypothetical protein